MINLQNDRGEFPHSALFRAIAVSLFLIVSVFSSLPEVSRAQCPDNTWNGPNQWAVIISGTHCIVDVYYCWKIDGAGHLEYTIEAVAAANSIDCATLTAQQIITGATSAFEADPPLQGGVTILPCGQGQTAVLKYSTSPCWHESAPGAPVEYANIGVPCVSCTWFLSCGDGACETDCEYCQDPQTHKIVEISCSTQQVLAGNCAQPPPDGHVLYDVCYALNPCIQ
jgi:hypothetical protein